MHCSFLSSVVSHSQSFLFNSLACIAVFSLLWCLFLNPFSLIHLHALHPLSFVVSHSQSFTHTGCNLLFLLVSHSQSLLSYIYVSYLICLPSKLVIFLSCLFLSPALCFPIPPLFVLQVQKHAITFLSLSLQDILIIYYGE